MIKNKPQPTWTEQYQIVMLLNSNPTNKCKAFYKRRRQTSIWLHYFRSLATKEGFVLLILAMICHENLLFIYCFCPIFIPTPLLNVFIKICFWSTITKILFVFLQSINVSIRKLIKLSSFWRMVFSRHLYFVDWSEFGCDIPYFNLVSLKLITICTSSIETNFLLIIIESYFLLLIFFLFLDSRSSWEIHFKILFPQKKFHKVSQ